jgi:FolB domain-containing protein
MDVIRIRGLEFDCIVGLRPLEREREQRVHLDLALGLDLAPAGRAGRIALTCDYTEIAEEVMAMLRFRRYQLIEMATEELAAMLLGVHGAVEFVDIHLDKPAALDGRARAASVEIHRTRDAFPPSRAKAPFGTAELLLETREASLHLLSLEPGSELASGHPREASWVEWAIRGEVQKNGEPLGLHTPSHGSAAEGATYANASGEIAVLFRCICPSRLDG